MRQQLLIGTVFFRAFLGDDSAGQVIPVSRARTRGLKVRWGSQSPPSFLNFEDAGGNTKSYVLLLRADLLCKLIQQALQASLQWQIGGGRGGGGGGWITKTQGLHDLGPTPENHNDLCTHVTSAFTLIIHVIDLEQGHVLSEALL